MLAWVHFTSATFRHDGVAASASCHPLRKEVDHQREQVHPPERGNPIRNPLLSPVFDQKILLKSRLCSDTHYLPAIPRMRTRAAQYSTRKYRTDHSHIVALPLARIAGWMRPCKRIQPIPV